MVISYARLQDLHEDGLTMISLPHSTYSSVQHTSGASVIDINSEGLFNSSNF